MPGKAAAQPVEAHWSGSPGPLEIKLEFQRKRPFRQALVCLVILPCKYRWPLPLVSPASSVLFLKRQEHKRAPKSSQRVHRKLKCVFQRAKGLPCQVFVFGEETGSGRLTRRTGASRPGFSPRGEWTALRARVELATSWFPDIVEFSEAMANAGKTVIVAALDGTFQRKAFGNILNLVPLAESVVKLTAVCMGCFREASYTKRLGAETEVEVIGGADKYQSVCRLCYFKKAVGPPAGLDNKENCPVPGRPGEAVGVRKLFAPHQILQCSPAN
ncbi:thymidine kinase, cytosolic isoform X1 [Dasypus novemcinctus]|uniref:thymidine kinase, cytosolic isoform X1 n=1 Tax=Dasypus novemcinctus TaxID=9361 RepID=UPI00062A66E6|nr:thymidine kinase, cytosolic isoform X2 [Dasypus novemcinctus]